MSEGNQRRLMERDTKDSLRYLKSMSETNARWLIEQETVGALRYIDRLSEENARWLILQNKSKCFGDVDQMNEETQRWLFQQAKDNKWDLEEAYQEIMFTSVKNKPMMLFIPLDLQHEVFQWDKKKTLNNIGQMSEENLRWLLQQTKAGHWDKAEVSNALTRAEKVGDDKKITEALAILNGM